MPQPFILLRFHLARAQPIMSEASNERKFHAVEWESSDRIARVIFGCGGARVLTGSPLNSYRRFLAASTQMLNQSARHSDDQPSSIAKPAQQLWTSAACPAVDHDARPEGEVSSSGRPPLSPRCVGIMAATGGIAVANLYSN